MIGVSSVELSGDGERSRRCLSERDCEVRRDRRSVSSERLEGERSRRSRSDLRFLRLRRDRRDERRFFLDRGTHVSSVEEPDEDESEDDDDASSSESGMRLAERTGDGERDGAFNASAAGSTGNGFATFTWEARVFVATAAGGRVNARKRSVNDVDANNVAVSISALVFEPKAASSWFFTISLIIARKPGWLRTPSTISEVGETRCGTEAGLDV